MQGTETSSGPPSRNFHSPLGSVHTPLPKACPPWVLGSPPSPILCSCPEALATHSGPPPPQRQNQATLGDPGLAANKPTPI